MSAVLLPANRTPMEAALDAIDAARFPLPTRAIASTWSPSTCPPELLGHLAWALSIELWDDAWDETRKRSVVANAFRLHARKTTLAGIRDHLALVDARLVRAIRPGHSFARGAITSEAAAAWLSSLPQIRIYPFARRAIAHARSFASSAAARRQFAGHGWLRASRGEQLLGRRASYVVDGVETPVTLSGDPRTGIDRVYLTRHSPRRLWAGHGHLRGFLRGIDASTGVITVQAAPGAGAFAVSRGAAPVSVAPTRISGTRIAPRARAFMGRFGGFLGASHAPLMIYDRIALNDPSRAVQRRKARSWYGHTRLGTPAFTAELRVEVPMHRARSRGARWHGVGFLRGANMAPVARAIEAVRVSKAARDTILIGTATHARATFGSGRTFGTFDFGDRMRIN